MILDNLAIQALLPHRYPFLLVDKVLECEPKQHLLGLKNVTFNEPFFQGHFPQQPIMPGVLILEALAQATALLTSNSIDNVAENTIYYLAGIDKARFRKPVVPGDQLYLEAKYIKHRRHLWSFACQATVESKVVASAEIMCAVSE